MTARGARALGGLLLAAACAFGPATAAERIAPLTAQERQAILRHGPWPGPTPRDPGNALSGRADAIALGRRLFFEARLSVDGSLSCASCHVPALAFSDGRPRSQGRQELDRNAPGLLDAGRRRWQGWDGAADSLWSQAIRPLLDAREMASDPAHLAAAIGADADLSCRYRALFGVAPDQDDPQRLLVRSAKGIGAFVASLRSGRTPFDRLRDALQRGRPDALSLLPPDALRGLRLFVGPGRCTLCHAGPDFSNGEFADIGIPFFVRPGVVDPGRHGGIEALRRSPYTLLGPHADPGTAQETMPTRHVEPQHRHFGEFKVPGLRSLVRTAPYMHDGRLPTLEAVVDHYADFNPERLHADGQAILVPLRLTPGERADLVAFLRSLSAPDAGAWQPARREPACRPSGGPGRTGPAGPHP